MRSVLLGLVVLSAAAASTPATGASITQFSSVDQLDYVPNFSRFDPTLGTLTKVTVDIWSEVQLIYVLENRILAPQRVRVSVDWRSSFGDLSFSNGQPFSRFLTISTTTTNLGPRETEDLKVKYSYDETTFTSQSFVLNRFQGSGDLGFRFQTSADPYVRGDPDIDFDVISLSTSSSIRLRYDYTEAVTAVPEPASWAMMIGGLGLLGASARRRRPVLA